MPGGMPVCNGPLRTSRTESTLTGGAEAEEDEDDEEEDEDEEDEGRGLENIPAWSASCLSTSGANISRFFQPCQILPRLDLMEEDADRNWGKAAGSLSPKRARMRRPRSLFCFLL